MAVNPEFKAHEITEAPIVNAVITYNDGKKRKKRRK